MGVLPSCAALTDARESSKIGWNYAGACFLLSLSLPPSSLCFSLSAFTRSSYIPYFWGNLREMIWNDLCPLSDSKIAQVIGFVLKKALSLLDFHVWLAAGRWSFLPLHCTLYSQVSKWVIKSGKQVLPPPRRVVGSGGSQWWIRKEIKNKQTLTGKNIKFERRGYCMPKNVCSFMEIVQGLFGSFEIKKSCAIHFLLNKQCLCSILWISLNSRCWF